MEEEGPPPTRWEVELEFVQGLANPMYVHFLAQQKYLENPEFLRYLEYLEYWREMPHVRFVVYPNCLLMLTLLKRPSFRRDIAKVEVAQLIMDGFFRKWQESDAENPEGVAPSAVGVSNETNAATQIIEKEADKSASTGEPIAD